MTLRERESSRGRRVLEGVSRESLEALGTYFRALEAGKNATRRLAGARIINVLAEAIEGMEQGRLEHLLASASPREAAMAMLEAVAMLEAQDDPLRRAHLRGIERKLEIARAEGGSADTAEAAGTLGITAEAVRRRKERGTILALPLGGKGFAYPRWQFDDSGERGILRGLSKVLSSFTVRSPWMQAEFMLARSDRLSGERPLDALRAGKVGEVTEAARAYGRHGAN
jgi:hypothetical protein